MSSTALLKIIEDDSALRQSISPDGWNWLLSSLDPFHDFAHPLAGYPDLAGAPSVVLEITRTATIAGSQLGSGFMSCYLCPFSSSVSSANANVRAGNWDTINPPLANAGAGAFSPATPSTNATALSAYIINDACITGDMVIMTSPVPLLGDPNTNGINYTGVNPANAMLSPLVVASLTMPTGVVLRHGITAPHRVIGAGFEVTNTTAPLYRSGSVVVYDSPSNWGSCDTFIATPLGPSPSVPDGDFAIAQAHFEVVMGPPTTLDQAILMPNSKQWAAEEGAYCMAKFSSMDNRVSSATSNTGLSGYAFGQESNLLIAQQMTGINIHTTGLFQVPTNNQIQIFALGRYNCYPFNGVGSWFTGLDPINTSMQVTVKWYLEVFPNTFFEQNLVPTTSPSAVYDPVALEVYARVVSQLPPGVPVKDNFLGLIGSAIGGLAKTAISGISNAIGGSMKPVDLQAEWSAALRKHGNNPGNVIHSGDITQVVNQMRDKAMQNLKQGVPVLPGEACSQGGLCSVDDVTRMYGLWFGEPSSLGMAHYPGQDLVNASWELHGHGYGPVNATNVSSVPVASGPTQSHQCNCPPHPQMGYQQSTGPRSREFASGMNLNPNHLANFIQTSVDKGITSAVRKLGVGKAPTMQLMDYDDYDYPEASEAVKTRRRLARRKRAEQVAKCREAGIIPALTPAQVAAIERQRAKANA